MKKCLSILLALLMILSSLPVMAFTASAEEADPNVMANNTYADWQVRRWGNSNPGTESKDGGNSIYFKSVNYQKVFTTVSLQPGKTYLLDFNWKADANENFNGLALRHIYVFAESSYGSNEALLAPAPSVELENYAGSGSWHHDSGDFYPVGASTTLTGLGADIESATQDINPRINATAGTWQHVSTKFTTNSTDTEYSIMLDVVPNSTGNAGPNAIHFSDFRLIAVDDSEAIAIEDKIANDWYPFQHSKIYDDNSFTQNGITSDYRVEKPVYQKISTVVELDPNTPYTFSFDYFSEVHAKGNPYVTSIRIFDYASGSVLDPTNWTAEADYNKSYTDIENGNRYGSASGAGAWQSVSTKFNTTSATKYNITICFHGDGFDDAQKVYLANFNFESFVASKPGNLLNGACYGNGDVSWSVDTGSMQDLDPRPSFEKGLDNPAFSIYGGYAWGFGFANNSGNLVGDKYARVHIKANGLKANKTYDFSYIYADGFRFRIDSIKSGNNTATYVVDPAYTEIGNPTSNPKITNGAEKATAMFTVPVDGDYVITLKSNRDDKTSYNNWSTTYLCDLELYEKGAMYNVSVSKEGNGFVKADKTGLTEEGTTVTFTARPEKYEKFLGWYAGDELVSEDLTYVVTVEGALAPVAKFTTNSENVLANYTAANFGVEYYGNVAEGSVSHYGGNAVRVNDCMYQYIFTTATLKPNTDYNFSFEWLGVENTSGAVYPENVYVYSKKTGDPFAAGMWVDDNGSKFLRDQSYPDLEFFNGKYTSQAIANTYTWQNLTTGFTTTEDTEYILMIQVVTTNNNHQSINLSDFVLKEKYVDVNDPIGSKTASDWEAWNYSEVSDSGESRFGGNAYYVDKAMYQSIATDIALKPGTDYSFSFQWKALANEKGNAYPSIVGVYSKKSGTIPPAGAENKNGASPYPDNGYENLAQNVTYPTINSEGATEGLTDWNTMSGTFTTTEDANYYLTIYFTRENYDDGITKNNDQKIYLSDFVIEEVVKGSAPAGDDMVQHPGVSIRKASESTFGQALRYKFTIDGDVIANAQTDGYELVEYGTVVALASGLEGHAADPILDATSYTVKTGVAYQKAFGGEPTTNIQYSVDVNGDVTYTAALYNIPNSNYSAECAVRPYAKFQNAEGDTYVRYGTTRYASVFAVAKAALEGTNVDDIDYVNNVLLAGSIRDAYNEWLAK